MTVHELIEELKKYPPEMRVVASGYEGGCDDVTGSKKIRLMLDYYKAEYYGRHEESLKAHIDKKAEKQMDGQKQSKESGLGNYLEKETLNPKVLAGTPLEKADGVLLLSNRRM